MFHFGFIVHLISTPFTNEIRSMKVSKPTDQYLHTCFHVFFSDFILLFVYSNYFKSLGESQSFFLHTFSFKGSSYPLMVLRQAYRINMFKIHSKKLPT